MEKMGIYSTSDLYVVSWLLSRGLQLHRVDRRKSQRCDFIFIDREDRPNLVRSFLCGQAEGSVPVFLDHFKRARIRLTT